jgi:hypothetical protein
MRRYILALLAAAVLVVGAYAVNTGGARAPARPGPVGIPVH